MLVFLEMGAGPEQDGDVSVAQGPVPLLSSMVSSFPPPFPDARGQNAGFISATDSAHRGAGQQLGTGPAFCRWAARLILDFTALALVHELGKEAVDQGDEGFPGAIVAGDSLLPLGIIPGQLLACLVKYPHLCPRTGRWTAFHPPPGRGVPRDFLPLLRR